MSDLVESLKQELLQDLAAVASPENIGVSQELGKRPSRGSLADENDAGHSLV